MKFGGFWITLLLFGISITTCVSPNSLTTVIETTTTTTQSPIMTTPINFDFNDQHTTDTTILSSSPRTTATTTNLKKSQNILLTKSVFINNDYHSYVKNSKNQNLSFNIKNMINTSNNYYYQQQYKKRDLSQNYVIPPCYKFEIGDSDMNTFYSPNYPDNYPRNIDCVRILEAPEDKLIRLDFRNSFKIEDKEDCKFDYLEIRDGPYGYSKEIGKFCGETFPDKIIVSKGRYLWLHFHSDESIEYSGFTAVYEFIKRPEGANIQELNCTILKDGPDGFINSTDVPVDIMDTIKQDKIPLDCMWVVKVREGWKIQIKFLKFSLEKPNDCDVNFVDIFKENTDMNSRLKNFCGSAGDSVPSETNILHVRFFADLVAIKSEFSILYTAFREKTASCEEDEYDCEDATCISASLKCNGRDNCKFRWDEDGCVDQEKSQSEHVVIIIIVFALILGGMVITFFVNCIRKLLKDQKIIREHIRQSKESKLDEMGRASAMRSKENLAVKLSPREKHSQSSLQILDDVSNRYYREIIPISSVQDKKIKDIKINDNNFNSSNNNILRQQRDIIVQTSLGGDDTSQSSPDRGDIGGISGTCEMACQTRESLFQPTITRQKSITSTSSPNQSISAVRFSTFGYDTSIPPPPPPVTSTSSSSNNNKYSLTRQNTSKSRTTPTTATEILRQPPPSEVCHHHHQHQQHLQQQQQQQQQSANSQQQQSSQHHQSHHKHHHYYPTNEKGITKQQQKTDDSKVFIDIRNSAPDVIIMTSH